MHRLHMNLLQVHRLNMHRLHMNRLKVLRLQMLQLQVLRFQVLQLQVLLFRPINYCYGTFLASILWIIFYDVISQCWVHFYKICTPLLIPKLERCRNLHISLNDIVILCSRTIREFGKPGVENRHVPSAAITAPIPSAAARSSTPANKIMLHETHAERGLNN